MCNMLAGERCSLCDYDLCCVCSRTPLNTLEPSLSLKPTPVLRPTPPPALPPPPLIDMSHTVTAPAPPFLAPPRSLFSMFEMIRTVADPVPALPAPSLKLFPMLVKKIPPPTPPVRAEFKPKFFQHWSDSELLSLPAWKPTVHPPVSRGSRMKLPGVRRSLTPHVLQPLPSHDGFVEQCD